MTEEWKDIKGYEGLYQVSSIGNIRSLTRRVKRGKGTILLQGKTRLAHLGTDGYWMIELYNKCHVRKFHAIHRLVAEAFVPNPKNRPEIDHINTIRTDNRVCNLRWVNRSENMANPLTKVKHLASLPKKRPWQNKPIVQVATDGTTVRIWKSSAEISEQLGLTKYSIWYAIHRRKKPLLGYKWRYADEL